MNKAQGLFDRTLIGVNVTQMGWRVWWIRGAEQWLWAIEDSKSVCYFVTDNEPRVQL